MQLDEEDRFGATSWQIVRLGEVCRIDKGQGQHEGLPYVGLEDVESGTGRFIGSKNAQQVKSTTFRFTPAHILYGRLRPYLQKALTPDFNGHCSTEIFPLMPGERLDRHYLHYWLLSDQTTAKINATCTGARMPRANMDRVLDFEFPLPPLPEQRRIVAILDEVFEGIDAAVANVEHNLASARELFESYLNRVFTEKGEGWVERPLAKMTVEGSSITYGVVKPGPLGTIPFVRGGDVFRGRIRVEKLRTITQGVSEQYKRTLLQGGELLVSLVGQPGETAVAPASLAGANIARQVGLIRLSPGFSAHFVSMYLRSRVGREALGAYESGSVQQVINLRDLKRVTVPHPPLDEQRTITRDIEAMVSEVERLESIYTRKLAALAELRQSVLHKAFSGELTVEENQTSQVSKTCEV